MLGDIKNPTGHSPGLSAVADLLSAGEIELDELEKSLPKSIVL